MLVNFWIFFCFAVKCRLILKDLSMVIMVFGTPHNVVQSHYYPFGVGFDFRPAVWHFLSAFCFSRHIIKIPEILYFSRCKAGLFVTHDCNSWLNPGCLIFLFFFFLSLSDCGRKRKRLWSGGCHKHTSKLLMNSLCEMHDAFIPVDRCLLGWVGSWRVCRDVKDVRGFEVESFILDCQLPLPPPFCVCVPSFSPPYFFPFVLAVVHVSLLPRYSGNIYLDVG